MLAIWKNTTPGIQPYMQAALLLNLFCMYFFFRDPFDFYIGYVFVFGLLPFMIIRYGVPKHIGIIFSVILLTGIAQIILGNNDLASLLKVYVGTVISYLFFYYVVFEMKFDHHDLFKLYLKGGFFCACVAIFQVVSYFVGFTPGYNLSWIHRTFTVFAGGPYGIRAGTFFGEPTYFAMFLSGAMFVAIHDLIYSSNAYFFNRFTASVLIVGVYASFSGTLVGTMVISIILIGLNYGFVRYVLIGFPIAAVLVFYIVTSSEEFSSRYQGTLDIFLEAPTENLQVFDYHGSSVILYNNFHIAKENFKRNALFGTGLGSHSVAVEKYSLTKHVKVRGFTLNTKDANSMFNRLMSETGLFGLGLMVFLIVRGFVRRKSDGEDDHLWLICCACLVVIFANLLRQGHYFLNGFPFYIWMYYRNYLEHKAKILPEVESGDLNQKLVTN